VSSTSTTLDGSTVTASEAAPDRTSEKGAHRRSRTLAAWSILTVIAGLAGLAYAWEIDRDPLEPYYEASVRSMSLSWHNFFYGAFDPAGTVSLDKLPGAFWIQTLSVRLFGLHTWAIVLPQVIAGILTVIFLFRAVERLMGTRAGLIAAFILAASPATVALNRGNIADTEMILFLVLAADAVSAAIVSGRQRKLIYAGIWVGLAFQTKMVEAWLVVPAMGLAYLIGSKESIRRRVRQAFVGGAVAIVVSLAWMTVVTAMPQSGRPYVDGSQHDSLFQQVFVYNGFGRYGQQTPLQLLFGKGGINSGLGALITGPSASWHRLFTGDFGRDTAWLLPTSMAIGVVGLFFSRRRSFYVLWTGWLLILVVAFSYGSTINSYYTAALSPPIAAILGGGISEAWMWWKRTDNHVANRRSSLARGLPLAVAVIVAATLAYGIWLAYQPGTTAPGWLWPVTVAVGGFAVLLLAIASLPFARRVVMALALACAGAAVLVIPASASALLVSGGKGIADTPFESASSAKLYETLLAQPQSSIGAAAKALERLQLGAPYLMAVQSSAVASVFIDATGREVLPIGGFTGTIPEPTVTQLRSDVRQAKFHLALILGKSHDPRLVWIETHCRPLGPGGFGIFLCSPGDASSAHVQRGHASS
jgi:4-amino-4-deoxy-L-arabinose transferase-like glycosyltransferase